MRIEQLYPFPEVSLPKALAPYARAEVVWCQEEPENMGAWLYADRRIEKVLDGIDVKAKRPRYVGRPAAASPATGSFRLHQIEERAFISRALQLPGKPDRAPAAAVTSDST